MQTQAAAENLSHTDAAQQLASITIPRIGAMWPEKGGIYAGILAGENGAPDQHIVIAPREFEIIDIKWADGIERASLPITTGDCQPYSDWSAPTRREARLASINSPETFDEDDLYWTSEQDALNGVFAWCQHFGDGYQSYYHKSNSYRVRPVRRFSVIE